MHQVVWPAPKGYEFPPDLDASGRETCDVLCRDGRSSTGELTHFVPGESWLLLRRLTGAAEDTYAIADIREVRGLRSVMMQREDAGGNAAYADSERYRYVVAFKDGTSISGQTINSVTTPLGVYLFLPQADTPRVRILFVGAAAVDSLQIAAPEPPVLVDFDLPMNNPLLAQVFRGMPDKYPRELEARYPRIFSRVLELWGTQELEGYFSELLIDDRGDRQGFPKPVLQDIMRLQMVHIDLMTRRADAATIWTDRSIALQFIEQGLEFSYKRFLQALEKGERDVVQRFVNAGVSPDLPGEHGVTPLMTVAMHGHETVALVLLQLGAHVSARDVGGYTALHWAAYNGHLRVVALLIGKGAPINVGTSAHWTPLIQAVARGHVEVVKLLLRFRADPNLADNDGWTPLHRAVANGNEVLVRELLAHHADTHTRLRDGTTPLGLLLKYPNPQIEQLLRAHGAW